MWRRSAVQCVDAISLCVVLLLPLSLGTWYLPDHTPLKAAMSCQRLNDNPELGRLCSVQRAYYDPRRQDLTNYDFLVRRSSLLATVSPRLYAVHCIQGSTPLLRLQVPALSAEQRERTNVRSCLKTDNRNDCVSNVTKLINFFGDIYLEDSPSEDFQRLCAHAHQKLTGPPIVFLVRDHNQMGHFLTVQLAPLIMVRLLSLITKSPHLFSCNSC